MTKGMTQIPGWQPEEEAALTATRNQRNKRYSETSVGDFPQLSSFTELRQSVRQQRDSERKCNREAPPAVKQDKEQREPEQMAQEEPSARQRVWTGTPSDAVVLHLLHSLHSQRSRRTERRLRSFAGLILDRAGELTHPFLHWVSPQT